jgi:hypothetical protein
VWAIRALGATIGTALKERYGWLDAYCPGCRRVKPIDLASVDIHPQDERTFIWMRFRQHAMPRRAGTCGTFSQRLYFNKRRACI